MRYPCVECEYVLITDGDLKQHIQSKHEWVRYPCDKCEYTATTASHLKRHIKSKHEG